MILKSVIAACSDWAKKINSIKGVESIFIFGSAISSGGKLFDEKTSDIDLVIKLSDNLMDANSRLEVLVKIRELKKDLEISLIQMLSRTDSTKNIVSIVLITKYELIFDIHKSGASGFFSKKNRFLDLIYNKESRGIFHGEKIEIDDEYKNILRGIQEARNKYLLEPFVSDKNLLEWDSEEDPIPKKIMRFSGTLAAVSKNINDPDKLFCVKTGLEEFHHKVRELDSSVKKYESLQEWISIRRGARGKKEKLEPEIHMLMYEIIFEELINIISKKKGKSILRFTKIRKQEKLNAEVIANVAFSPCGEYMAYNLDNKLFTLKLSDAFPKKIGEHVSMPQELSEGNHLSKVQDVVFSPDSKLIASSDIHGNVKIWEHSSKKLLVELNDHKDVVTSVCFSPRGNIFASAGYDEFCFLYDVSKLIGGNSNKKALFAEFHKKSNIKKKPKHPHDIEQITAMSFSNDGKYISTGDQKGNLVVREIDSKEEVYRCRIHNDMITSMSFSPVNSALLATASADTRIILIDFKSSKRNTLGVKSDKHTDTLNSIAFSHKGDILLSSACDRFVKMWDVERLKLIDHIVDDYEDRVIDKVIFYPNKYDFAANIYSQDISLWSVAKDGDITRTKYHFD